MQLKRWFAAFVLFSSAGLLTVSCGVLQVNPQATIPPTELLPTWVAQTVAAREQTETALTHLSADQTPSEASASPAAMQTFTPIASATLSFIGPSPTATSSHTPTATPEPTRPTRTPTPLPTVGIPDAAIYIQNPGPQSRIVTPLQVRANVRPGLDGRVRIELLGEDGRLLVRKIINYGQVEATVFVSDALEFEISAVAETARLVISTYDDFGRIMTLQSVEVILLSIGEDDITPPGKNQEPVVVQEPLPNKLIQGGTLFVNGLARLPSDQSLLIELITAQGKLLGYRLAGVTVDPTGTYTPFSAEVPYEVEGPTWARMLIQQESQGRIPGMGYATSYEILLSP